MLLRKNEFITNKTNFFLIFFINICRKYIMGLKVNCNQLYLYLENINLINILTISKYNSIINLTNLVDIVVVDNVFNKNRFEITYVFWNIIYEYRIGLKIFNNGIEHVYSSTSFYKASGWLEREIWDMYGIKFLFHSDLRRILTDYGFKGYPLRKDFPLLGYVDVYYDDSIQSIKVSPIELSQSLRFYRFENPWNKWYLV